MVRQMRPSKVFQNITAEMQSRITPKYQVQEPPWYKVLYSNPPSEIITRTPAVQLQEEDPRKKRVKNVYRPQQIVFPEDKLRQTFFKEHPWELARPRMVIESHGRDSEGVDWSKGVRQPGMILSGECVVQRQLWLMDNEGMSTEAAYDIARREFYKLRQQEQIEQRIAREEATFVGAYFDKTRLEIGHELESREFEAWKRWAGHETERLRASIGGPQQKVVEAPTEPVTLAAGQTPTHDLTHEGY